MAVINGHKLHIQLKETMATIPYLSSLNPVHRPSSPKPIKLFPKSPPFFKLRKLSSSLNSSNSKSSQPINETASESKPDPIKLAFERAQKYKKSIQSNPAAQNSSTQQNPVQLSNEVGGVSSSGSGSGSDNMGGEGRKEVPVSVKLAMEKAKEYKKDRGVAGTSSNDRPPGTGVNEGNKGSMGNGYVEKKVNKDKEPTISSIDFVGLNFADKKEGRGLPAGLVPVSDPFPEGDLPEVELIVGDTSKFGEAVVSSTKPAEEDDTDLYKPKVSTWGVFPRPNNISKTFGGGKNIQPGQVLETAEEKAVKQAQTRRLIAAYKTKIGLNIDPKLKSECEKALSDGDSLMDSGNLKEALPYYEKVMNKLVFQSKLHGLAALQWSICLDSLSRRDEARSMYERLQSHPNAQVSKKARQFVFSFQAMEMMKVTDSSLSFKNTEYQNYFDAFIKDKPSYPLEKGMEEGVLNQALPYFLFLVSPIFIVLFIAVQKGLYN